MAKRWDSLLFCRKEKEGEKTRWRTTVDYFIRKITNNEKIYKYTDEKHNISVYQKCVTMRLLSGDVPRAIAPHYLNSAPRVGLGETPLNGRVNRLRVWNTYVDVHSLWWVQKLIIRKTTGKVIGINFTGFRWKLHTQGLMRFTGGNHTPNSLWNVCIQYDKIWLHKNFIQWRVSYIERWESYQVIRGSKKYRIQYIFY